MTKKILNTLAGLILLFAVAAPLQAGSILDHEMTVTILLTIRKKSRTVPVLGKLVFQRYGTSFFLAEVWSQNNATGATLAPSAREKELAREKQPEQILVVQAR